MASFASDSFPAAPLRGGYRRADVELHGVDQAVPSYEGRIFVNQPEAGPDTPPDPEHGYLGSFHVFGKVECWGDDEEHCAPATGRSYDRRRPPGREAKVRVRTPDGLLARLAGEAGERLTLNLVAVVPDLDEYRGYDPGQVMRFSRLSIVTYA